MPENADRVGTGYKLTKQVKPTKIKVNLEKTPVSEVAAEANVDWLDYPQIKDQISNPDAYRLTKQEVMVFDLSKVDQLKAYNDILTMAASNKANIVVLEESREFSEKSDNWKMFVKVQHVEFKKIFKKGLKPDTVEAQEQLQQSV